MAETTENDKQPDNAEPEVTEPERQKTKPLEPEPQEPEPEPQEPEPEPQEPEPEPQERAAKEKSFNWVPVIVLSLLILAVAGVGFYVWQDLNNRFTHMERGNAHASDQAEEMSAGLAKVQKTQSQVQSQLSGLEGRISISIRQAVDADIQRQTAELKKQVQTDLTQNKQSLDEIQIRMKAYQNRLSALSTTTREDWKLAEAEYLLRLANQRVLLENNPVNAAALLEAADGIIEEASAGLGDPELFTIRRSLTDEIAQLKLIVPVDRDGLYLLLQSMAAQVEKLPIERQTLLTTEEGPVLQPSDKADDTQVEEEISFTSHAWQQIKSMAGALNQYIRIEHDDETLNPLLSQQAAQLTRLNVRILLQQAQVALLKEQPDAYQSSLQRAIDQVQSTFPQSEQAKQYVDILESLAVKTIRASLPDLSGSLKLLNEYIEQLHRQGKAAS